MQLTDLLERAASLVESFAATLNTNTTRCDHCGRPHYERFDHFQAKKELTAIVRKLKRWSDPANSINKPAANVPPQKGTNDNDTEQSPD